MSDLIDPFIRLLTHIIDATQDRPEILVLIVFAWCISWVAAWWMWTTKYGGRETLEAIQRDFTVLKNDFDMLREGHQELVNILKVSQEDRHQQLTSIQQQIVGLGERIDRGHEWFADKSATEQRFASVERSLAHFMDEATQLIQSLRVKTRPTT